MADLKIIICDVGNAASAIVKVPTGYSMMIDCGCNQEKNNPVDIFFNNLNWLQSKDYVTQSGVHYKLALLHITHPDDDHVRNAERVRKDLTPYLVHRNNCSLFSDSDSINQDYKKYIDSIYNGNETCDQYLLLVKVSGYDILLMLRDTYKYQHILEVMIYNSSPLAPLL